MLESDKQIITAPQLGRSTHKPGRGPLAITDGALVAAARAAAPAVYAKRTPADRRADAADTVRRAIAALRGRAMRVFQSQRRAHTDAERELFTHADDAHRAMGYVGCLYANTPQTRANSKAITERALGVIDRLEKYRGAPLDSTR